MSTSLGVDRESIIHPDLVSIAWMPTFRCNLKCPYCIARMLPGDHGTERRPDEWIEFFHSFGKIHRLTLSGGEVSLYQGLGEVLRTIDVNRIHIDTNLVVSPETWLVPEILDKLVGVHPGLHFHPDHERAKTFWEHLQIIRDKIRVDADVNVVYPVTAKQNPDDVKRFTAKMTELFPGRMHTTAFPISLDFRYMYRDICPKRGMKISSCSAGHMSICILPDGSAYRCLGQLYHGLGYMGNVFEGGKGILLTGPEPCEDVLCTLCDDLPKLDLERMDEQVEEDFWYNNPMLRATYFQP